MVVVATTETCRNMCENVFKHSIKHTINKQQNMQHSRFLVNYTVSHYPTGSSAVVRTSEWTGTNCSWKRNCTFPGFIASYIQEQQMLFCWSPRNVFNWPWLLGRTTKTSIGVAINPDEILTGSLPNVKHYCYSSLLEPLSSDKWVCNLAE